MKRFSSVVISLLLLLLLTTLATPAQAFDFFGLFKSPEKKVEVKKQMPTKMEKMQLPPLQLDCKDGILDEAEGGCVCARGATKENGVCDCPGSSRRFHLPNEAGFCACCVGGRCTGENDRADTIANINNDCICPYGMDRNVNGLCECPGLFDPYAASYDQDTGVCTRCEGDAFFQHSGGMRCSCMVSSNSSTPDPLARLKQGKCQCVEGATRESADGPCVCPKDRTEMPISHGRSLCSKCNLETQFIDEMGNCRDCGEENFTNEKCAYEHDKNCPANKCPPSGIVARNGKCPDCCGPMEVAVAPSGPETCHYQYRISAINVISAHHMSIKDSPTTSTMPLEIGDPVINVKHGSGYCYPATDIRPYMVSLFGNGDFQVGTEQRIFNQIRDLAAAPPSRYNDDDESTPDIAAYQNLNPVYQIIRKFGTYVLTDVTDVSEEGMIGVQNLKIEIPQNSDMGSGMTIESRSDCMKNTELECQCYDSDGAPKALYRNSLP